MIAKLMTVILIIFSLAGFAIPAGVLHTTPVFAQTLEDDGDAEAELEEQDVDNEATTIEDSSSDDNALDNENEFGDDDTVVDQDNEADQDVANVGVQEQEATQTADQDQDAVNTNVDFDVQVGGQQPPPPTEEPEPEPEPPGPEPEEVNFFCLTINRGQGEEIFCAPAEDPERCESIETFFRGTGQLVSECQGFEEPPPGARIISGGPFPD
jgi:hypothetical protein